MALGQRRPQVLSSCKLAVEFVGMSGQNARPMSNAGTALPVEYCLLIASSFLLNTVLLLADKSAGVPAYILGEQDSPNRKGHGRRGEFLMGASGTFSSSEDGRLKEMLVLEGGWANW